MKVPVRSVDCRHLECLDLHSYLDYHKQMNFWECAFSFCKAQAHCASLRVDEYVATRAFDLFKQALWFSYMSEVLRDTNGSVLEIEVLADGSFKELQPPAVTASIDDGNPTFRTAPWSRPSRLKRCVTLFALLCPVPWHVFRTTRASLSRWKPTSFLWSKTSKRPPCLMPTTKKSCVKGTKSCGFPCYPY